MAPLQHQPVNRLIRDCSAINGSHNVRWPAGTSWTSAPASQDLRRSFTSCNSPSLVRPCCFWQFYRDNQSHGIVWYVSVSSGRSRLDSGSDKSLTPEQQPRGWHNQKTKNCLNREPETVWFVVCHVRTSRSFLLLYSISFSEPFELLHPNQSPELIDHKVHLPARVGTTSSSTSETGSKVLRSIAVTTVRVTEKEKIHDESGRDADDRKSDERKRCRGGELLTCSLALSAAGAESADFLPSKRRRSRAGREGGRGRGRRKSDVTWEKNHF